MKPYLYTYIMLWTVYIYFYKIIYFQQDFRKSTSEPVLDMNIVPVFYELNITGKNVNITVPDDGIEWTHPEILPNFVNWNI